MVAKGIDAEFAEHLVRFGITSISPARGVASDPEAIVPVARATLEEAVAELGPGERATFRVATNRADKRFPMKSVELDRFVAAEGPRLLMESHQIVGSTVPVAPATQPVGAKATLILGCPSLAAASAAV